MRRTSEDIDLTLVVHRREPVADDVILLELRHPEGTALPPWTPGAHVDLDLGGGLVRQYSLCGDPGAGDAWSVGVLREEHGRGGSQRVHDQLLPGEKVAVTALRNNFALEDAPSYLFVAGGIGITPLVPMVREAQRRGATWSLLYGGRSGSTMAFTEELAALGADHVRLRPQDEYGLLDLDAALAAVEPDAHVYCCGPEPLLAAVTARCEDRPAGSLHLERFTPKELEAGDAATAFEVEVAGTGQVVEVPADRSILAVLTGAGYDLPSSCQEGTCGTCETTVVSGAPDHRDSLLTPEEQEAGETMMICVSRSCSGRLVLDL